MAVSDEPLGDISNDPSAWLDDHGDYLMACALTLVRGADAAEDLVQDTLLAAVRSLAKFEGRSSFRTWLVAIMRHKAMDAARAAVARRKALSETSLETWAQGQFTAAGKWVAPPAAWPGASDLQSNDLRAVLEDCIGRMPPRNRDALQLADQRGLTLEQISNVLGVTPTHVGVILHRTRLAMRHCLDKKWFGAPHTGKHT